VNKSLTKSFEFDLNCVIRKIFVTKSNEVVNDCLSFFNCMVSDAIYNRKFRFLSRLIYSDNVTVIGLLSFCPRCSLWLYT